MAVGVKYTKAVVFIVGGDGEDDAALQGTLDPEIT
jgi:hypothetical protein